jgi:hypothetical protein
MCARPGETSREYHGGDACTLKKAGPPLDNTGVLNTI